MNSGNRLKLESLFEELLTQLFPQDLCEFFFQNSLDNRIEYFGIGVYEIVFASLLQLLEVGEIVHRQILAERPVQNYKRSHYSLKKVDLKNLAIFIETAEKRFEHKCFPVKIAKFLRTPILKNIRGQLLLKVLYSIAAMKNIAQFPRKYFSSFLDNVSTLKPVTSLKRPPSHLVSISCFGNFHIRQMHKGSMLMPQIVIFSFYFNWCTFPRRITSRQSLALAQNQTWTNQSLEILELNLQP